MNAKIAARINVISELRRKYPDDADKLINELGEESLALQRMAIDSGDELYNAWKKFEDLPDSKVWVRSQEHILDLMNSLSAGQKTSLLKLYNGLKLPQGADIPPPFVVSKRIEIPRNSNKFRDVDIQYDEFGFPKFEDLPDLPPSGIYKYIEGDANFVLDGKNDIPKVNAEIARRHGFTKTSCIFRRYRATCFGDVVPLSKFNIR